MAPLISDDKVSVKVRDFESFVLRVIIVFVGFYMLVESNGGNRLSIMSCLGKASICRLRRARTRNWFKIHVTVWGGFQR